MSYFKVIKPGLMSTIQDLGRIGHQSSGFSPAGSVDQESAILANDLLSNPADAPVIEMTMLGMTLKVLKRTYIASAGARMSLKINGESFPNGRVIPVNEGDIIEFGMVEEGLRTYLAVPGGFVGEESLGSVSTHTRSGIGGFRGRALAEDDVLSIKDSNKTSFPYVAKKRPHPIVRTIRIIEGPEFDRFDQEAVNRLTSDWYVIQNQSDRMGIRLSGNVIETIDGSHDIISAPTHLGNVQVPKNGLPIILLNDRQSSGGYTRIATVIKVDLLKLAQMKPGERFKFELVSMEEAQRLYFEKSQEMKKSTNIYEDRDFKYYRRTKSESVEKLLKGARNE